MSDNISRKALCEYALNQKEKSVTPNDIMRFPSTDRTGNWLEGNGKPAEGLHDVYCSECGEMSEYRSSFCPHCGADMRGV